MAAQVLRPGQTTKTPVSERLHPQCKGLSWRVWYTADAADSEEQGGGERTLQQLVGLV